MGQLLIKRVLQSVKTNIGFREDKEKITSMYETAE
jgi:hypothetical protein